MLKDNINMIVSSVHSDVCSWSDTLTKHIGNISYWVTNNTNKVVRYYRTKNVFYSQKEFLNDKIAGQPCLALHSFR